MILYTESSEWSCVVVFENSMPDFDELKRIVEWCDRFTPQYLFKEWFENLPNGRDRFCFLNQEDALLFILRWSHLDE